MNTLIDARARPPIPVFLGDRTYTNLTRTLTNVTDRGWTPTRSMRERDLDAYLAESRAAGIAWAGVPARVPNKWWGGAGNEGVFEARDRRPDFFFAYAALDPFTPEPEAAVAELRERGSKAVILEPGICDQPAYVDDPGIDPVYDACQRANIPVLLMGGGETGPDLSFSDPSRFERVAMRFPDLTLVNVHGGWPYTQETLGVAFRRPNVWLLPDVYFPGLPGEADYVLAMRTFLRDRFLFASGYPFCPIQQTVERYLGFGLPDAILRKVFHDNAARLFGLVT